MFDWTINVGNVMVFMGVICTGFLYAFRSGKFAESIKDMKEDITDLKEITKELAKLLTTVAVHNNQMESASDRINLMDRKIEDLRKGDGFIRGRTGIDGEYK